MRARRRSRSGSIHAPVDTPTGTPQASRTAWTTGSTTAASRLSRPSARRGCRCIAPAPAAAQAAASRASSARVRGTAAWSAAVRSPLSAAWSSTRRRLRGARAGQRSLDERALGLGVRVDLRPRTLRELVLQGLVLTAQPRGATEALAEQQLSPLVLAVGRPDMEMHRVVGGPEQTAAALAHGRQVSDGLE